MASYTNVTVTEADAYRALVAWVQESLLRMTGADRVPGVAASGRPIRLECGIFSPGPDIGHPPILLAGDTVNDNEKNKLANYMQGFLRWVKGICAKHSISETIVIANAAFNANVNTQMTAIRAELVKVVTAYAAAVAATTPGNAGIMALATPPALA
jgi:hypothetical protein